MLTSHNHGSFDQFIERRERDVDFRFVVAHNLEAKNEEGRLRPFPPKAVQARRSRRVLPAGMNNRSQAH
jgi:hypothetical protein